MSQRSSDIPLLTREFIDAPRFYVSINTRPVNSGDTNRRVGWFNKPTHAMVHIQPVDGDYLNPEAAGLTVDFNPEGIGFFHRSFTSCSEEAGTVVGQKYGRPGLNYTAIRHWLVGHQDEYSAETYSLVNHNCQHFARHFYNFLTKINEDDPDDPVVITHTRGVIDALKNVGLFVFGMATVGVAFVIGSAVNGMRTSGNFGGQKSNENRKGFFDYGL